MPAGIIATVDNGFAVLDFIDPELRGPALAALIELGGAESIEPITRSGPRKKYRVPADNAEELDLIDGTEGGRKWSAGADTGAAARIVDANPNTVVYTVKVTATGGKWKYTYGGLPTAAVDWNVSAANLEAAIVALANVAPGEVSVTSPVAKTYVIKHTKRNSASVASDTGTPLTGGTVTISGGTGDDAANFHTPYDQYTSANKYVGQVSNDAVLHNRSQVYTGDAGSFGGQAEATPHRELIDYVKDAEDEAFANATPPIVQSLMSVSTINTMLGSQPGALGSDPGSQPDAGGSYVSQDYTAPETEREESTQEGQTNETLGGKFIPDPTDPVNVGDPEGEPVIIEYPEGEPSDKWTRPELDAYALNVKGLDTTGLGNKAEVLAAINAPTA